MQRIAIIGCGMMGRVHSGAYATIDRKNFEVIYVSDPILQKAANCSEILGGVEIASFEKILEDDSVTVVDICTPTYMHKDMVLSAAKNGKNVFCEKPVSLSRHDSLEMIAACEQNAVKLGVGHVTRFFPEYVKNIELIKSGEIGKPVMARLYRGGVFPSHGMENWFNAVDLSGGVIVDLSIHDIDLARQIFGEVEHVEARSAKLSNGSNADNFDHAMTVLRFKSGAIVHIEGSWAQPTTMPVGFRTAFEIYGEKGMINFDSEKNSTFRVYSAANSGGYLGMNCTAVNPYALELEAFVNSVDSGGDVPVDGNAGLKTLEIALAANISAKESRTVYMKELNLNA